MIAQKPMGDVRHAFRIVSEPRGAAYEAIIDYCASKGEFGTLIDMFPNSRAGRAARTSFLERTEQHLTITLVERWPLTEPETGSPGHPRPLWKFKLVDAVIDALLDAPCGLFDWKSPKLPEDLAIYRKDGSVLLGTVVHEHIGWMNLSRLEAAETRLGLIELAPKRTTATRT